MNYSTDDRRTEILAKLTSVNSPIKASDFAKEFGVSRQIIVGDIAILRAAGHKIIPTPHGYMLEADSRVGNTAVVACRHSNEDSLDELYVIVDNGGTVIDVTVEHPVYGEIHGLLNIESRYDADKFAEQLKAGGALTLSSLTEGIHLHTISYRDQECLDRIRAALEARGYLLSE